MSAPPPFAVWMIPLFPLFFIATWLLATGLLAAVGGWSELARLYPSRRTLRAIPSPRFHGPR